MFNRLQYSFNLKVTRVFVQLARWKLLSRRVLCNIIFSCNSATITSYHFIDSELQSNVGYEIIHENDFYEIIFSNIVILFAMLSIKLMFNKISLYLIIIFNIFDINFYIVNIYIYNVLNKLYI